MKRLFKNMLMTLLLGVALLGVSACSSLNSLNPFSNKQASATVARTPVDPRVIRQPVTLTVNTYADQRVGAPSRKIGNIRNTAFYASGNKEVVMQEDVAAMVTSSMRKHFAEAGYLVQESGPADFSLNGVVRDLRLEIDRTEYLLITVESTMRDGAGNIVWTGVVTERADRIEDTAGNMEGVILRYVTAGLTEVATRTQGHMSGSIRQAYPEIFRHGTVAANAYRGVSPAASAASVATVAAASPPQAAVVKGLLMVTTQPARAQIFIGDVYYGLSPIKLELDAGVHVVVVKLDGFKSATNKVSVRKGDTTELELKLLK